MYFCPTFLPSPNYSTSLHDALPISRLALGLPPLNLRADLREGAGIAGVAAGGLVQVDQVGEVAPFGAHEIQGDHPDRKSTRQNSSHLVISYAVFSLKINNNRKDR